MRRPAVTVTSAVVVVVVAVVSFGGGVGVMALVGHREVATAHPASRAVAQAADGQAQALRGLGQLLAPTRVAKDLDWSDPEVFGRLHAQARSNAMFRKELMDTYAGAGESEARHALGALLANLQTPDVVDFAMMLARSGDTARRRDGMELLAGLGMKLPEIRQVAREVLQVEKDPAVVSRALAALQPAAIDQTEGAAVMAQIHGFVDSVDPDVRAQAITALAGWDKTGASADALEHGMTDVAPEVRWSAITAVAKNRIRSPALKDALLAVLANGQEEDDLRLSAARALESFTLDADEVVRITQAAMAADRRLYADGEGGGASAPGAEADR